MVLILIYIKMSYLNENMYKREYSKFIDKC